MIALIYLIIPSSFIFEILNRTDILHADSSLIRYLITAGTATCAIVSFLIAFLSSSDSFFFESHILHLHFRKYHKSSSLNILMNSVPSVRPHCIHTGMYDLSEHSRRRSIVTYAAPCERSPSRSISPTRIPPPRDLPFTGCSVI